MDLMSIFRDFTIIANHTILEGKSHDFIGANHTIKANHTILRGKSHDKYYLKNKN